MNVNDLDLSEIEQAELDDIKEFTYNIIFVTNFKKFCSQYPNI